MANLKEIRTRIASVSANMKITQAMKMVSASKFRRAADAITRMRPYSDTLKAILSEVAGTLKEDQSVDSPYTQERKIKKVLLVVYTSNKGLIGAFNTNAVKKAREAIEDKYASAEVELLFIGSKGYDFFKKHGGMIAGSHSGLYDDPSYEKSSRVASQIMEDFASGKYDAVELVYNRFKNAATQIPTLEPFLPLSLEKETSNKEEKAADRTMYIFEPDEKTIVQELIPQSLKLQFFKVLKDTIAAEHGARMTAMHQATDNAKALCESLTIYYNKERQSAITNQILEIVNGAEALANG